MNYALQLVIDSNRVKPSVEIKWSLKLIADIDVGHEANV